MIVFHIRNIIGGPGHVIVIERKTKQITKFGRKVEEEPIRIVVDGGDILCQIRLVKLFPPIDDVRVLHLKTLSSHVVLGIGCYLFIHLWCSVDGTTLSCIRQHTWSLGNVSVSWVLDIMVKGSLVVFHTPSNMGGKIA